jgi:hypothetical protein
MNVLHEPERKFTTHAHTHTTPDCSRSSWLDSPPESFATLIECEGSLGHPLQAVNHDPPSRTRALPDISLDQVRCVVTSSTASPAAWRLGRSSAVRVPTGALTCGPRPRTRESGLLPRSLVGQV